ncbi:histidine kinase, partial [Vibrio parahaemolyticus]|nr:histidine kinase [Vibrio parahaemolyticus]
MKTSATLNILHFLEKLDPFDKLPTEIVEQLAELVVVRYLAKGETIDEETLSQSAHLYFIRSGAIEQKDSTGGLLARLGENDQFGFTFFQDSSLQSQRYQVYALDSTLLYS